MEGQVQKLYEIIIINSDLREGQSLKSMVSGEFSVKGVFENTGVALDFFKSDGCDIVIADDSADPDAISSFIMGGAEILVLCRYTQLTEAKKLSDIGVSFYLLKPVRYDEFSYALSSVKLSLDKRNISRLQNIESLDFEQFMPVLREQFFSAIANGTFSSRQELREQAAKHSMEQSICGMPCSFTEVHITEYHSYITNKWKYGRETLYTAIGNLLSDTDEFSFQMVKARGSVISFIVMPSKHISIKTLEDSLRLHIMKSTRAAFELFGLILFIDNKRFFPSLFDMMEYTSGKKNYSENTEVESDRIQQLISSIKMHRGEEANRLLEEYFLIPATSSPENAAGFLLNVLYIVCDALFPGDAGVQMRKKAENSVIDGCGSFSELFSAAKALIPEFIASLKKNSRKGDEIVISKAKRYIRENCADDISLSDVAEFVYLNPVYFSRMFKQKTGENFSDYLLRVRMEKASELLAGGGVKVNEAAAATGFKNAKYFSRLFRKYTGCSPREYSYMYLDSIKQ